MIQTSLTMIKDKSVLKEGDRVKHILYQYTATIKSIPNKTTAWIQVDGDDENSERGVKLIDLGLIVEPKQEKLANRFNSGKIRFTLIPVEAEEAEARVWMKGAIKYGERNWEKGLSFLSILDSLDRHMKALKKGELIDSETGEPHAAHIRCNAAMLIVFEKTHPELNDLIRK